MARIAARAGLAATMLGAVLAWAGAALAQVEGRFNGIDAAEGMALEITRGGDRGTLDLGNGNVFDFRGEAVGETVEATFEDGDITMYLRAVTEPLGARVILVPMDEERQLRVDLTAALVFLREGVSMPEPPTRYLPPPTSVPRAIDPRAFVSSFPFWPPLSVALAYEALEPRFRTVIKLFPLVQADLLWKLCASPQRTPGIAEALRGQGLGCGEVSQAFAAMQRRGTFDRFKRDATQDAAILMQALGCADDLRRTDPACANAGRETASRAVSMETAATVLARYR